MYKKVRLLLIIFIAGCTAAVAAKVDPTQPIIMTPEMYGWTTVKDMPMGAEVTTLRGNPSKRGEAFTVQIKLPANYVVPVHSHPINEYDTVISGTYYLGMGDEVDKSTGTAMPAGSYAMIPAKVNHYAWTKEQTILQVSGIGPWGMIYPRS